MWSRSWYIGWQPYLIRVQKYSVAEGLICNENKDEGLYCNQKDGGGSEDDDALNVNFEDSYEDAIGIREEIVVDKEDGKGKGKEKGKIKGKRKVKGKGKRKGKDKGKGKGKGKAKVERPRKQRRWKNQLKVVVQLMMWMNVRFQRKALEVCMTLMNMIMMSYPKSMIVKMNMF